MKWLKAAIVGLLGSLVMFIFIMLGTQSGVAPFNSPPSGAFLAKLGIAKGGLLPLLVHFGYGAFWSMVLVTVFKARTSVAKGLLLASGLWLFMMIVYSPIIGWGFFGFGGAGHGLPADHPLHLGAPLKYAVVTLVLHLIYGFVIGWLNPLWIHFGQRKPSASTASGRTAPLSKNA